LLLATFLLCVPFEALASRVPRGSSSNWSGYAVMGRTFSAVSARWVQPAASCLDRWSSATDASFWVGLGGNSTTAKVSKVEQIGTDSDCRRDGTASYYGWYELWPAPPINLNLPLRAGDQVAAAVRVRGARVMLQLADLTTGRSITRWLPEHAPDLSSAEWIVEAPSYGNETAAMTNFGSVRFTDATAVDKQGHAGAITDRAWQAGAINFASELGRAREAPITRFLDETTSARAIPSPLGPGGRSFQVTWQPATVGPTLPPGAA
jgi:hypothetical protein